MVSILWGVQKNASTGIFFTNSPNQSSLPYPLSALPNGLAYLPGNNERRKGSGKRGERQRGHDQRRSSMQEIYYPSENNNGSPHLDIGGYFYATCEGKYFLPLEGKIWAVNTSAVLMDQTSTFEEYLWAADGAFVDPVESLLYVSEVMENTVLIYNLSSKGGGKMKGKLIHKFTPPNCEKLDDFCISRELSNSSGMSSDIIGADFEGGNVISFRADGSSKTGTILATCLRNPTSVRAGRGPGWGGPRTFYVTEGGPLMAKPKHNRRVWKLQLP